MYQIEPLNAAQGVGLWVLCAAGFAVLWYVVGYLFGDTDRRRTPLQNLVRRAFECLRWAGAVLVGLSYAIDAGLYGYYFAMRKPLPQPRSERVRPSAAIPPPVAVPLGVPALRLWKRTRPERVA